MPHPRHIVVVCGLVRSPDNTILAVRHKIRGWELPQGRVEEGEDLLSALHREVLEESGVVIGSPQLAAIWSKLSEPTALIHGFLAEYVSGALAISAETPEVAWLTEDQARSRFEHPVNRDRLIDLLQSDQDVRIYRYTTGPYRKL